MVGETRFHRWIHKASVGRNAGKRKDSFREEGKKRAPTARTVYVSLDRADAIIEGGRSSMSNTYDISKQVEREIRTRDKTCVYCHILMKRTGGSGATIEHFNNDGPLDKKYNLAVCCRRCNSSKGTKRLSVWFKTDYCHGNKINAKT